MTVAVLVKLTCPVCNHSVSVLEGSQAWCSGSNDRSGTHPTKEMK